MKKLLSIAISLAIMLVNCNIYAADSSNSSAISAGTAEYSKLIEEAKESILSDNELIDEDNIAVAEVTNEIMLERGIEPTMIYVLIPLLNSEDVYYAYFQNGELTMIEKNFSAVESIVKMYDNLDFLESYGIDNADSIKSLVIFERTFLYAYNIEHNGETYIIPYDFAEESLYNVMGNESCELEIGKAYKFDDFVNILLDESELYNEYRSQKREEENKSTDYVDTDEKGNEIIHVADKEKEDINEENTDDSIDSEKNEVDGEETTHQNENITLTTEEKAQALFEADLLKGTDKGFELEKTLTRAEAATLIVRMINKEKEALNGSYQPVFADVNEEFWGFNYIMYGYDNGIIKGISETEYAPQRDVTAKEFLTLSIRGIVDTDVKINEALNMAVDMDIISETQKDKFLNSEFFCRADVVDIIYNIEMQ